MPPWNSKLFPPQHHTLDKAHGRLEQRSIWSSTELKDYLDFPYAAQVFAIRRDTTEITTGKSRTETVYGLTSLTPDKASPQRLLELSRGHWSIENRLHWVRDVTFDEDRSRIRKFSGPQVMASIRNLAISLLRMAGATNIAQASRYCARLGSHDLRFIGIQL